MPGVVDQQFKVGSPAYTGGLTSIFLHGRVVWVVALSGGYHRDDANERLARNHGMIASSSRALTEGLTAQQSDDEFNATLDASIQGIYEASLT
jgi:fructose-bisphosphate aldolase class I